MQPGRLRKHSLELHIPAAAWTLIHIFALVSCVQRLAGMGQPVGGVAEVAVGLATLP